MDLRNSKCKMWSSNIK